MHFSSRLIFSLLGGVAAVSLVFDVYQATLEMPTFRDEVQKQSLVLAESQRHTAKQLLLANSPDDLQTHVDQFQNQEQLAGIALYDATARPLAMTSTMTYVQVTPAAVIKSLQTGHVQGEFLRQVDLSLHVLALPLSAETRLLGAIAIFHKVGFTRALLWRLARMSVVQTLLIVGVTLLLIRRSVGTHLHRITQWLRETHAGKTPPRSELPKGAMFQPLAYEVTRLATSLYEARAIAEEEARLRDTAQALWTPERLRISVQSRMKRNRLFAVSNREPYEHTYQGNSTAWRIPPSGLVTALEPVLRACDGTWVAQATGDADRETSNELGQLRVPPDHPQYTLRRVWLTEQEEDGFYFGFANEGLWPLCHVAHTRPIFRTEDWNQYQAVNRKFAVALLEEMHDENEPFVLVQDYHFALLPRMLKESRPDARVALFWHIPWPNPEAFGICPWQQQLLDGMLGADLIGFHIQAHCNNFLATVDRALESRVDQEHFAVNRRDHETKVKPFPISVAVNGEDTAVPTMESSATERARLLRQLGIEATFLGIGVDRVDYTKGIPERFRGIERLLELYPDYAEKLTFVQIGAPSRTHIKRYQDLMAEVEEEAERINRRFRTGAWSPIVFLNRHHSHGEIVPYYRAAQFCLVTSLHDGMNLVAKEYIATRQDERGSLILSRFTGASHELPDALIVNPYDTDELARGIHTALTMPDEERRARMARMRAIVKEHNIYWWAGNLIGELAEIRLEPAEADQPGRRDSLARHTQFTIEDPKIYAKPWTNKQDGFVAKIG
jgi:alpha,alpha-trehalose-phosphate synthase [UDP-forming]